MVAPNSSIEVSAERTIPAPTREIFDAWLDPKIPGTLWHGHEKLIFNPAVDGLWYLRALMRGRSGSAHYGRFIEISRSRRIAHTWISRMMLGEETLVTVHFENQGVETLISILHSGLPNSDIAIAHEEGWNSLLDRFSYIFVAGSRRRVQ